ncbi:hypothetical protein L596_020262 [Steinernema carpocapsae]|uniref:Uncharacterized protein n=1 Tax=Steinernema carpocapsae TaxID=34508 RepID=A0A4U5MT05_STECR|nr:hypothetical protein L596_020262 [Steinernema carpocapsae]
MYAKFKNRNSAQICKSEIRESDTVHCLCKVNMRTRASNCLMSNCGAGRTVDKTVNKVLVKLGSRTEEPK